MADDVREALLPCPFCGGKPGTRWCGGVFLVECSQCHISKGDGGDEDWERGAYTRWNARAALAASPAASPAAAQAQGAHLGIEQLKNTWRALVDRSAQAQEPPAPSDPHAELVRRLREHYVSFEMLDEAAAALEAQRGEIEMRHREMLRYVERIEEIGAEADAARAEYENLRDAHHNNLAALIAARELAEQYRVDAERLDWLDRDDIELLPTTDRNGDAWMFIVRAKDGEKIADGPTIRDAIDAARSILRSQGSKP